MSVGPVTGEEKLLCVKVGSVLADSSFSNKTSEVMEGIKAGVVYCLDRARTGEKFKMRDRHPVQSRRGLFIHAVEDALEKLSRRGCGDGERGEREALDGRSLEVDDAEGCRDVEIIEVCRDLVK